MVVGAGCRASTETRTIRFDAAVKSLESYEPTKTAAELEVKELSDLRPRFRRLQHRLGRHNVQVHSDLQGLQSTGGVC